MPNGASNNCNVCYTDLSEVFYKSVLDFLKILILPLAAGIELSKKFPKMTCCLFASIETSSNHDVWYTELNMNFVE